MILSRVELPWVIARRPYEQHRALWRLFPGQPPERRREADQARTGFLFRIEDAPTGGPARVLVQSRLRPMATSDISILASREFQPQPRVSQALAFVVTANPVKTVHDQERGAKPGKRSSTCRVPLIDEKAQIAWLGRKLLEAAVVESVAVVPHAPIHFRRVRTGERAERAGKLVPVTFEGSLRVTDPVRLVSLLENGIGAGKAFGCGLFLVRRL
ncbi:MULTISPECIES: type I-E CRISPR-associated protein Cas6/Cse3/CasE [Thiorhodovibrio]|uniref:type I-E CRISPR-associated protein Cas6/Cse3/CasE n=1 Tax=Thiorhodovibrio TaxID=61593 RepID=UPI0019115ED3|nr:MULTISPECIES: type I-E CRISPR-associated protein Cas6/Cse3/CasE [Thiorhodovibrio]MBK5968117.1 type I-E CRISPR-associated protein Cas6/Cse3/CasE [Thiorhodovibrio winogradskyi]WPL12706.1 CRISPR system Cascade subunit CasE [Thiorhodovibrio litoralis]